MSRGFLSFIIVKIIYLHISYYVAPFYNYLIINHLKTFVMEEKVKNPDVKLRPYYKKVVHSDGSSTLYCDSLNDAFQVCSIFELLDYPFQLTPDFVNKGNYIVDVRFHSISKS